MEMPTRTSAADLTRSGPKTAPTPCRGNAKPRAGSDRREKTLESAEFFAGAVASLPAAIRRRLDGGASLDWAVLEHPGTSAGLGAAIRAHRRLPEPVETLVQRLIRDVGIVPADVVEGVERQCVAGAWIDRVTIEADGETYRIRNHLSGESHTGIRADTVAGYAMLAMELATEVHDTAERWLDAGDRFGAAPAGMLCPLALCAVRMSAHLRAAPRPCPGRRTTAVLADILETAWNTQSLRQRAELSTAVPPNRAHDARAPRRRHFAPLTSYRLHAYDLGEIRWLRALAERAGRGAPERTRRDVPTVLELAASGAPEAGGEDRPPAASGRPRTGPVCAASAEPDPDQLSLGRELAGLDRMVELRAGEGRAAAEPKNASEAMSGDEVVSLNMTALEARIGAETAATLELGSDPGEIALEEEFTQLELSADGLPGAVRRRLASAYGINAMQALTRLQDRREIDAARAEMKAANGSRRAPRWLEDLAATLLIDAGAQTREGLRTASLRLDLAEDPEGGYLATEEETGARGILSLAGLVEQMQLSLGFARSAWTALTVLGNAGKEGGWALREMVNGNGELAPDDGDTLHAAQQIGYALDGILHARSDPNHAPSALEQASIAADALVTVGPTIRAAAGWPGAAQAPSAGNPEDVARIAAVAEALQGDVRAISNRLIAGRMVRFIGRREEQEA